MLQYCHCFSELKWISKPLRVRIWSFTDRKPSAVAKSCTIHPLLLEYLSSERNTTQIQLGAPGQGLISKTNLHFKGTVNTESSLWLVWEFNFFKLLHIFFIYIFNPTSSNKLKDLIEDCHPFPVKQLNPIYCYLSMVSQCKQPKISEITVWTTLLKVHDATDKSKVDSITHQQGAAQTNFCRAVLPKRNPSSFSSLWTNWDAQWQIKAFELPQLLEQISECRSQFQTAKSA